VRLVVTGATGGIGSAIVRSFRDRGDDVLAVARPSSGLEALCADTGARPAPVDLRDPAALPAELAGLAQLDGLVHACSMARAISTSTTSRSARHRPRREPNVARRFTDQPRRVRLL
jgi:NADP-dependent 3-hydroxy acid dehydrogenase YdfG